MFKLNRTLTLLPIAGLTLALWAGGTRPAAAAKDLLVIGLPIDVPIPDAHKVTGLPAISAASQVGERLVLQEGDKVVPWLAESWELADGGRSLIFKIRDGVVNHDGSPLTVEDVKWSIDRFRKLSIGRSALGAVTAVTIVPPNKLKLSTKEPFAPLLRTFSYAPITVYSKHAYDAAGDDEKFSRHPVGPGAYKFVEWVPGQRLVFEAHEKYWAGVPKIKRIEYRTIFDEASRIAALEAGEVDVIYGFSPTEAARMKENKALEIYNPPSAGFIRLNMNTRRPPFNDVRVRRAIGYAIDREEFSKGLFLNTAPVAHSLVSSQAFGYTAEYDVYAYNPARARQLLQEAGQSKLTFTLAYGSGRNMLDSEMAALVQAQLAKIGVTVKIDTMEWGQFSALLKQPVEKNTSEMTVTWWRTVNADPDSVISIYSKQEMPPGNNVTLYESPAFERAFLQQQIEPDPAKRLKAIKELQRVLMEDLPSLPMYNQPQFWAARSNVVGFKDTITALNTNQPLHKVNFR